MASDFEWIKLEHLDRVIRIKELAKSERYRDDELRKRMDDDQEVGLPDDPEADDDEEGDEQAFALLEPDQLLQQLRSAEPDEQEEALAYLLREEEIPATPELSAALASLLRGDDDVLRDLATSVIAKAGQPILTAEIVSAIVGLLDNQDGESWDQGTVLVCGLGRAIDYPEVRIKCERLTHDPDAYARASAAQALAELGRYRVTPEIVTALARLLQDEERDVRLSAVGAVMKTGVAAGENDMVRRLARLLSDDDDEVRQAAAQAICDLRASGSDVIHMMLPLLNDRVGRVRKLVGRFIADVPAAAEKLCLAATKILAQRAGGRPNSRPAGLGLGPSSSSIFSPAWFHPAGSVLLPSGAGAKSVAPELSGTLGDGRITYKIDRDINGLNIRFGSDDLDLEHTVVTIDITQAAGPGAGDAVAKSLIEQPVVRVVVLQKIGLYQVGGQIRISGSDLPQPGLHGVKVTPRAVS